MRRTHLIAATCALCTRPSGARRVVAVGDLHGDLSTAQATLRGAGLMDDNGLWTGGDALLVQMGDVVDRGPDGHGILDMLARLRADAPRSGGVVRMLIGNHEVMNLKGEWQFVDPLDLAAHGSPAARKAAYSATGHYGALVRGLPFALREESTLFVHGGLLPQWAARGIGGINSYARERVAAGDWDADVLMNDGPVWTRKQLYAAQKNDCALLKQALEELSKAEGREVRRMVVGHTVVRPGQLSSFCDGALLAIDVRASAFMEGGGWSVWLELEHSANGSAVANQFRVGQQHPRPNLTAARSVPRQLPHGGGIARDGAGVGQTALSAFVPPARPAVPPAVVRTANGGSNALHAAWDPRRTRATAEAHLLAGAPARSTAAAVFAVAGAVCTLVAVLWCRFRRRRQKLGLA